MSAIPIPLRVVVYDRGPAGVPTRTSPVELAGRLSLYEDAIDSQYGFESLRVAFECDVDEALSWLRTGLMRPIESIKPSGATRWDGLIYELTATFGKTTIVLSLEDVANRLRVKYANDAGGNGKTTTYSHANSIATYGTKDLLINASSTTAAGAANRAQTALASLAWPTSKRASSSGPGGGGRITVEIKAVGWYETLDWVLTSNASTTVTQTSAQVVALLTAYNLVNNWFSAAATNIVATGHSDTEYIDPENSFREKLETLLGQGTAAQQRLAWGIFDASRAMTVRVWAGATPSTIAYYETARDNTIRDPYGNLVAPWDLLPDAMAETVDLFDAPAAADQVATATRKYVRRVTLKIDSGGATATLEPDDVNSAEALLAGPVGGGPAGQSARQSKIERRIKKQVAASVPSSDSPAYSGGVLSPSGGGTGGTDADSGRAGLAAAPADAAYILKTADAELPNAQVLGVLATGLLKNTTTTGTLSIAVAGTDYVAPGSLNEAIDDRVAALLVAGTGIGLSYNDAGNALTVTTTLTLSSLGAAPSDATYIVQTASSGLSAEQALGSLATGLLKNTTTTGVLSIAVAGTDYLAPGGAAPVDAKYIVQTSNGTLTNEQVLGSLATGLVKNTTTTGVLSIAVAGTDYVAPGSLNEAIDDRVAALLVAGTGIGLSYNDAGNALTISNTGGTVGGTGTAGRIMQWAVGGSDGADSTLAKTGAGVLTFAAAGTYTATVAATGTVAFGTGANLQVGYWSGTNTLTGTANLVWNAGVNKLVVNATIAVQGSVAGIDFHDRNTNSDLWSIYSESNELRFWEAVPFAQDDAGLMYRMSTTALFPSTAGAKDLGTASLYWNEINYKLLTDRGCLGWYDEGVELQDGRLVSDVEALKAIRPHPYKRTPAGAVRFDYTTLPRHVYRPAPIATEAVYTPGRAGEYVVTRAGDPIGEDGAETTALISILIGAIKELEARLAALET